MKEYGKTPPGGGVFVMGGVFFVIFIARAVILW
jgi:hypothetical protein